MDAVITTVDAAAKTASTAATTTTSDPLLNEMTSTVELSLIDLQLSDSVVAATATVGDDDFDMNIIDIDDSAAGNSNANYTGGEQRDTLLPDRDKSQPSKSAENIVTDHIKTQQPGLTPATTATASSSIVAEKKEFATITAHIFRRNRKFLSKPCDWLLQDIMDDYILKMRRFEPTENSMVKKCSRHTLDMLNYFQHSIQIYFSMTDAFYERNKWILDLFLKFEMSTAARTEKEAANRIRDILLLFLNGSTKLSPLNVIISLDRSFYCARNAASHRLPLIKRNCHILKIILNQYLGKHEQRTRELNDAEFIKNMLAYRMWLLLERSPQLKREISELFVKNIKPRESLCFNESFAPALPPYNPKISGDYVRLLSPNYIHDRLIASLEPANPPCVRYDNKLIPSLIEDLTVDEIKPVISTSSSSIAGGKKTSTTTTAAAAAATTINSIIDLCDSDNDNNDDDNDDGDDSVEQMADTIIDENDFSQTLSYLETIQNDVREYLDGEIVIVPAAQDQIIVLDDDEIEVVPPQPQESQQPQSTASSVVVSQNSAIEQNSSEKCASSKPQHLPERQLQQQQQHQEQEEEEHNNQVSMNDDESSVRSSDDGSEKMMAHVLVDTKKTYAGRTRDLPAALTTMTSSTCTSSSFTDAPSPSTVDQQIPPSPTTTTTTTATQISAIDLPPSPDDLSSNTTDDDQLFTRPPLSTTSPKLFVSPPTTSAAKSRVIFSASRPNVLTTPATEPMDKRNVLGADGDQAAPEETLLTCEMNVNRCATTIEPLRHLQSNFLDEWSSSRSSNASTFDEYPPPPPPPPSLRCIVPLQNINIHHLAGVTRRNRSKSVYVDANTVYDNDAGDISQYNNEDDNYGGAVLMQRSLNKKKVITFDLKNDKPDSSSFRPSTSSPAPLATHSHHHRKRHRVRRKSMSEMFHHHHHHQLSLSSSSSPSPASFPPTILPDEQMKPPTILTRINYPKNYISPISSPTRRGSPARGVATAAVSVGAATAAAAVRAVNNNTRNLIQTGTKDDGNNLSIDKIDDLKTVNNCNEMVSSSTSATTDLSYFCEKDNNRTIFLKNACNLNCSSLGMMMNSVESTKTIDENDADAAALLPTTTTTDGDKIGADDADEFADEYRLQGEYEDVDDADLEREIEAEMAGSNKTTTFDSQLISSSDNENNHKSDEQLLTGNDVNNDDDDYDEQQSNDLNAQLEAELHSVRKKITDIDMEFDIVEQSTNHLLLDTTVEKTTNEDRTYAAAPSLDEDKLNYLSIEPNHRDEVFNDDQLETELIKIHHNNGADDVVNSGQQKSILTDTIGLEEVISNKDLQRPPFLNETHFERIKIETNATTTTPIQFLFDAVSHSFEQIMAEEGDKTHNDFLTTEDVAAADASAACLNYTVNPAPLPSPMMRSVDDIRFDPLLTESCLAERTIDEDNLTASTTLVEAAVVGRTHRRRNRSLSRLSKQQYTVNRSADTKLLITKLPPPAQQRRPAPSPSATTTSRLLPTNDPYAIPPSSYKTAMNFSQQNQPEEESPLFIGDTVIYSRHHEDDVGELWPSNSGSDMNNEFVVSSAPPSTVVTTTTTTTTAHCGSIRAKSIHLLQTCETAKAMNAVQANEGPISSATNSNHTTIDSSGHCYNCAAPASDDIVCYTYDGQNVLPLKKRSKLRPTDGDTCDMITPPPLSSQQQQPQPNVCATLSDARLAPSPLLPPPPPPAAPKPVHNWYGNHPFAIVFPPLYNAAPNNVATTVATSLPINECVSYPPNPMLSIANVLEHAAQQHNNYRTTVTNQFQSPSAAAMQYQQSYDSDYCIPSAEYQQSVNYSAEYESDMNINGQQLYCSPTANDDYTTFDQFSVASGQSQNIQQSNMSHIQQTVNPAHILPSSAYEVPLPHNNPPTVSTLHQQAAKHIQQAQTTQQPQHLQPIQQKQQQTAAAAAIPDTIQVTQTFHSNHFRNASQDLLNINLADYSMSRQQLYNLIQNKFQLNRELADILLNESTTTLAASAPPTTPPSSGGSVGRKRKSKSTVTSTASSGWNNPKHQRTTSTTTAYQQQLQPDFLQYLSLPQPGLNQQQSDGVASIPLSAHPSTPVRTKAARKVMLEATDRITRSSNRTHKHYRHRDDTGTNDAGDHVKKKTSKSPRRK